MNRCLWPIAAMALIFAAPAVATVALQVNSSGVVTGATGVNVAGSLYDVNFVDGTCASVFGTCDSAHFAFTTDTSAVNASQALLDQVFVGPFALFPQLTSGCSSFQTCAVITPYSVPADYGAAGYVFLNGPTIGFPNHAQTGFFNTTLDTSSDPTEVYAVFTAEAAAVPEPATWVMMLLGFAGIAMIMRRPPVLTQIA